MESGEILDNTGKSIQIGKREMPRENRGNLFWGSLLLTSGVPWIKSTTLVPKRGDTSTKTKASGRGKRSVSQTPPLDLQCGAGETCKNVCFDQNFNYTNCYCDIGCLLFGDCCFDFFEACLNTSIVQLLESVAGSEVKHHENNSDILTGKSHVSKSEETTWVQNCNKPVPNDLHVIRSVDIMSIFGCMDCIGVTNWRKTEVLGQWFSPAYQLVSKCPETWKNQDVRHRCENQTDVTFNNPPIHDGPGSILSFRNLHCAMCHERSLDELRPWNLTLTCPETDHIDSWIKEEQFVHSCCRFIFKPLPDLKDATRRCPWNVSEQNASSVWASDDGRRKCNGDLVTSGGQEDIGGFGLFNEPERGSVTSEETIESFLGASLSFSKKTGIISEVGNFGIPKQSDDDTDAKDSTSESLSMGTFAFFKPLGSVPIKEEKPLESSSEGTLGVYETSSNLPSTDEPTLVSNFVGNTGLSEPKNVVSSTAEPVLESFVGTIGLTKSPNAILSTGSPAQGTWYPTQQTVEDLVQKHSHPASSTQTSSEMVSLDDATVWQQGAYHVSLTSNSALAPYMAWCDYFGTLSYDESSECHCPRAEDSKTFTEDEPSLMVPLSALFTLDPNHGIKVTFSIVPVENPFISGNNLDNYGQCTSNTIFMADTKRCEASVCDLVENTAFPCVIDSSEYTFRPEDNFTAVISIEVNIRLFKNTALKQTAESLAVRRIYGCFLKTQATDPSLFDPLFSQLTQEWSRVTKTVGRENAFVKPPDFTQIFTDSGNKSSCREISLSQRLELGLLDEQENLTNGWYQQEVVSLMKFRCRESPQLSRLFGLLGKSVPQLYLDEFTLTVFTIGSVIVTNFNQSTAIDCDGELKTFDIQTTEERHSGYWIVLPQSQGKAYLRYSEVLMRNEYIYKMYASGSRIIRGTVCQRLGNLTGYNNCTAWIGIPHSAQISNGPELFVEMDGFEHKVGQFLNTSSKLLICREGLQRLIGSIRTQYDKTEQILNYIGFSLSLAALLLTLLTYLLIRTLRNLPGKIVMCFSLTMFSAILLFMVLGGRVHDETLCGSVAIVLHFLWLSVFLWVNTLSFDVSRALSGDGSNVAVSDCGKSKRLTAYMLYALGIPMLIICATLTKGFLSNPGSGVGGAYGSRRLCWIRDDLAVYAFYCPVGLTLCINLILFVRSVRGIHTVSKLSKAAAIKSDNPGNAFLFVKLSLVMGLSWLLFYLLGIITNQVVRLLCSTVNSFQGVFVFLVFVCNKRVWRNYRKLFRRRERSADEKTAFSNVTSRSAKGQSTSST